MLAALRLAALLHELTVYTVIRAWPQFEIDSIGWTLQSVLGETGYITPACSRKFNTPNYSTID